MEKRNQNEKKRKIEKSKLKWKEPKQEEKDTRTRCEKMQANKVDGGLLRNIKSDNEKDYTS